MNCLRKLIKNPLMNIHRFRHMLSFVEKCIRRNCPMYMYLNNLWVVNQEDTEERCRCWCNLNIILNIRLTVIIRSSLLQILTWMVLGVYVSFLVFPERPATFYAYLWSSFCKYLFVVSENSILANVLDFIVSHVKINLST